MRNSLMVVAAAVGLFGGTAQADTITDACAAVAADSLLVEEIYPTTVQSFPELNPPRVTMRFSLSEGASPEPSAVRCEFENRNRPVNLTRYCVAEVCIDERLGSGRLIEHRTLLDRRGY